jgi:hypothetical protein
MDNLLESSRLTVKPHPSHGPVPLRAVSDHCGAGGSHVTLPTADEAAQPLGGGGEAREPPTKGAARSANARLTAGLKCAPESGPDTRVSAIRRARVSSAF